MPDLFRIETTSFVYKGEQRVPKAHEIHYNLFNPLTAKTNDVTLAYLKSIGYTPSIAKYYKAQTFYELSEGMLSAWKSHDKVRNHWNVFAQGKTSTAQSIEDDRSSSTSSTSSSSTDGSHESIVGFTCFPDVDDRATRATESSSQTSYKTAEQFDWPSPHSPHNQGCFFSSESPDAVKDLKRPTPLRPSAKPVKRSLKFFVWIVMMLLRMGKRPLGAS